MTATQKHRYRINVCNVLVIGAGGAGLRAAIAAHEAGKEVCVLGKRMKKDAHTVLAAGGINAVLGTRDPQDSWECHFADTIKEGYYLADPKAVEILCRESPARVQELADWGCPFALTADGKIDQRYFGAHRWRRTCYAGDWTGRAVLHTLVDRVEKLGLEIGEHQYVWSLLAHENECFGALSFDLQTGEITVHQADAVVIATGGHTRLWLSSSSRAHENGGDGMHLALKAGAQLADMELVQFHPTGMTHPPEWAGILVTEAVRGEGGHLKNSKGERFMSKYDPKRMELSTRDRVALANYSEIQAGRGGPNGGVFLDVSHLGKEAILKQLPRMYRQFMESQLLDISKEPMEVSPTAHYSMGGVVVDAETHATCVKGLFAVGELTSGVHGANRLGGNSLAETVVFGKIVGEQAAHYSHNLTLQKRNREIVNQGIEELYSLIQEGKEFVKPIQRELRTCMWEHCGVVRSQERLAQGLKKLAELEKRAAQADVRPTAEGFQDLAHACDLRAALVSAKATLLGALWREESRGAHQREDFPQTLDKFVKNCRFSYDGSELKIEEHAVPPIPGALQAHVDEEELEIHGRLLE